MKVKRADIKELREMGLIHELNRLFLHPMGFALEIIILDNGEEKLGGIWDYRDNPEGILFNKLNQKKIDKIKKFRKQKAKKRKEILGFIIQEKNMD